MAKTVMPLMSATASGQLAKTIVFMTWKGINDARKYLIPANPNTTGQQAQRNRLTNTVNIFHATAWNDDDLTGWNRYATTLAQTMSGFNAFVRECIAALKAGLTWYKIYDYTQDAATPGHFSVSVQALLASNEPVLHYGQSPTYMPNTVDMVYDGGTSRHKATAVVWPAGTVFYCWIDYAETGITGRTGIYKGTAN